VRCTHHHYLQWRYSERKGGRHLPRLFSRLHRPVTISLHRSHRWPWCWTCWRCYLECFLSGCGKINFFLHSIDTLERIYFTTRFAGRSSMFVVERIVNRVCKTLIARSFCYGLSRKWNHGARLMETFMSICMSLLSSVHLIKSTFMRKMSSLLFLSFCFLNCNTS